MNKLTTLFLVIAGALLLVIGLMILMAPHAFHGSNGIALGNDPNLLSEVRAPGGLLTACGVLILAGALQRAWRPQVLALTVLVYGSFGLARVLSMVLDGLPSASLVAATALELAAAAMGVWVQRRSRRTVADGNEHLPLLDE